MSKPMDRERKVRQTDRQAGRQAGRQVGSDFKEPPFYGAQKKIHCLLTSNEYVKFLIL